MLFPELFDIKCKLITALCPKGYASETGLALFMTGDPTPRPSGCQPCPSGYFQEMEGQLFCTECPRVAKSRENREATVSVFECEGITRLNWSIKVVTFVLFTEGVQEV